MATYTIKSGDTLSKIAEKFNTTVTAIRNENKSRITDPNKIQAGWIITIPSTRNYEAIGKAFDECVNDIENLPSFKKLKGLL